MAQPRREAMAARGGLSHLLGTLEDLRQLSSPSSLSLGGCIYALGEPWGVFHLALYEIYFGREANSVSIKSASSRFFCFAALLCRRHISYVRTLNNANSVCRLCATKLSPTLVFIAFLENEDKIPKTASEENLSDFGFVCAAGISGAISPSSLTRIGPSICPNEALIEAHNFGIQPFSIRGRLSL